MTSRKVIIVGSGLFGSIAATLARSRGHEVTVIDNKETYAASKASGCVLAPSWLASLSDEQRTRGMGVLKSLYKVEDLEFTTNVLKSFKAQRVDPQEIILDPDITGTVMSVADGVVTMEDGSKLKGRVLVAAGLWSGRLVEMPPIRGLYGASMLFKAALPLPKIHVYAPYRQAVAFQMRKGRVWFGDGTALIEKSWHATVDTRLALSRGRAEELFGLKGKPTVHCGARPYVEGYKAGYFARVSQLNWVSTGGAKNGTLLAADQAGRFIEEAGL